MIQETQRAKKQHEFYKDLEDGRDKDEHQDGNEGVFVIE